MEKHIEKILNNTVHFWRDLAQEVKKDWRLGLALIVGVVISLAITLPYMFPKKVQTAYETESTTNSAKETGTYEVAQDSQERSSYMVTVNVVDATKEVTGESEHVITRRDNFDDEDEVAKISETAKNVEDAKDAEVIAESTSYDTNYDMFVKLVAAESGNCGLDEQEAVAQCIWNRAGHDMNNIMTVATARGQFSTVKNGQAYANFSDGYRAVRTSDINDVTKEAVGNVVNGKTTVVEEALTDTANQMGLSEETYASGGPIFFYSPKYCSESALADRAAIAVKVQIGNQVFYKAWQ